MIGELVGGSIRNLKDDRGGGEDKRDIDIVALAPKLSHG
jgi:hypothetical protein